MTKTKASDLVFDRYLPGQLLLSDSATANNSTATTLDGSVYNDVWRFYDSSYDACQLSVELPCKSVVRVESFVSTASTSSDGAIGQFYIATSLSDPTTIWAGDANSYRTRATENTSVYVFGQEELEAGSYDFRPVWRVQNPYTLTVRFHARLSVMAWASP